MDERLEVREILHLLKKRSGMILLIVLASVILAGGISYYVMSPVYQSSTQILVSRDIAGEEGLTDKSVQADLQLVSTYRELIESPVIMGKVIEQLRINKTVEELKKQFTVISNAESQLIEIYVADTNQQKAVDIANTTALIFQEEVESILKVNNVKILFPAAVTENKDPISPSPMLNMAVGAVLGLITGAILAILLSYLDTTIRSERDVEKYLEVPVLAVISSMNESLDDSGMEKVVLQEKEA